MRFIASWWHENQLNNSLEYSLLYRIFLKYFSNICSDRDSSHQNISPNTFRILLSLTFVSALFRHSGERQTESWTTFLLLWTLGSKSKNQKNQKMKMRVILKRDLGIRMGLKSTKYVIQNFTTFLCSFWSIFWEKRVISIS